MKSGVTCLCAESGLPGMALKLKLLPAPRNPGGACKTHKEAASVAEQRNKLCKARGREQPLEGRLRAC